jgi:16S rRNA (guanine527-N7)-methyltransferase
MAGTEEAHGRALRRLSKEWEVPLDGDQAEALLAYARLLLTWGAKINLTGARSIEVLLDDHFPDAFAVASRVTTAERAVDVGSGGGLPALPLALLRPGLSIDLCEPVAKKGAFLRTAIRELGVSDRVRLRPMRGEALADAEPASFDVALSRATFSPAQWLVFAPRLVRPGGRIFALAAPDAVPKGAPATSYLSGRRALVEVRVPLGGAANVPRGTSSEDPAPGPKEPEPASNVPRGTSSEDPAPDPNEPEPASNVPRGTPGNKGRGV